MFVATFEAGLWETVVVALVIVRRMVVLLVAVRLVRVLLVAVLRVIVLLVAVGLVRVLRLAVRVLARVVRRAGVAVVEVGLRLLLGLHFCFCGLRVF